MSMMKKVKNQKLKVKSVIALKVAILVFLYTFLFAVPRVQAASATLSLSPSSKSVTNGQTFSVEIRVDTAGESINTVTANLSYPTDKLRAQSVDTSGSFVTIWFENNIGTASGEIRLTGSLPTPGVTGSSLLFATVNFVALSTGTAQVEFANSSAVYRNSDNSDILGTTVDGTYTISELTPTETPTPTLVPGQPTSTPTLVPGQPTPTPTLVPGQPTPTSTLVPGQPTPTTGLPDVGVEGPTVVLFLIALGLVVLGNLIIRMA